jgi:RNA polymerase sigma-70 factor (ECF subfamily)
VNLNKPQASTESSSDTGILHAFNRYKSALKYFVSSYLVNSQDVEDVCQETFLRTYKSSLENDVLKPKSFMFRVAKNLIISDFRKASVQLNDYIDDIDLVDPQIELDNIENNALAQEKLGIMCEAIAALPNKCRQVVVMRKVYGLATKDIAKRMNISPITVSNYITKGMCAYNDALQKYNQEHHQPTKPNDYTQPLKTGERL